MDDDELIAQIRRGNANAYRILVDNHKNLVWHMVLRMVSQQEDAEDLCQDVFLNVFRNIRNFRGDSKLSSWIGSIAYHVCIDFLRKKGREKSLLTQNPIPDTCGITSIYVAGGKIDRDRLKTVVHAIIEQLPVQYRTVITLCHLENCSYKEIAGITGMPEGTVKSYISRAKDMIREQVLKQIPDIQLVLFEAE